MSLFDKKQQEPFISSYKALDKRIICPNCGNDKFLVRDVLLNTPGMTFFGLDWANRNATALICTSCTRIEWYFEKPAAVD
ncbi:MAG: DNA-binding protein [Bacteroidota bacterium]